MSLERESDVQTGKDEGNVQTLRHAVGDFHQSVWLRFYWSSGSPGRTRHDEGEGTCPSWAASRPFPSWGGRSLAIPGDRWFRAVQVHDYLDLRWQANRRLDAASRERSEERRVGKERRG